ncbi:hypothetical protein BDW22DRAFT_1433287 [Trametopsis cervina]|nr:hypothetical protein BDW22DRAFT_1433287 [Trametopsis cervina]
MDPSAPFLPSNLEAAHFYYGLESKPILVARSDRGAWVPSQGSCTTYVQAKVLTPLVPHFLNRVWDETEQGAQYTGMTLLRIGIDVQDSPPAVIFIGVRHGSLTREKGCELAVHCHGILAQNNITDIQVHMRESEASLSSALLFKPAITANVAHDLRKPSSTSLSIPICNADSPHVEGTRGFYFTPGRKLFKLTVRHVVLDPDAAENEQYECKDGMRTRRINVMFLDKAAFDARV